MVRLMRKGLRLGLWGLMLAREKVIQFVDERCQKLDRLTLISRHDVEELGRKIDVLAAQIENLARERPLKEQALNPTDAP